MATAERPEIEARRIYKTLVDDAAHLRALENKPQAQTEAAAAAIRIASKALDVAWWEFMTIGQPLRDSVYEELEELRKKSRKLGASIEREGIRRT